MKPRPESALQSVLSATKSTDPSVRRAGRLFYAGIIGTVLLFGAATWTLVKSRRAKKLAHPVEIALPPPSKTGMARLGTFLVPLINAKGPGSYAGENTAEIELILECELPSSCKELGENLPPVRDIITSYLHPIDRLVLVSPEGKNQMRTDLLRRLQDAFPAFKIKDLFFVNVLLE